MNKIEITNDAVFTVYSWFQSAMKQAGRYIKFPKCKDKTKTYQFRWTKSFADKCYNDLGLDNATIKRFVYDIVVYAKQNRVLDRGTQILTMDNIIDICYNSIQSNQEEEDSLISELSRCHDFLQEQENDKDILVRILSEPVSEGGYTNLVYWCELGYLTPTYLALSMTCQRALKLLPKSERSDLPSDFELFKICTHTVTRDMVPSFEDVLGSDLRIPPTARK